MGIDAKNCLQLRITNCMMKNEIGERFDDAILLSNSDATLIQDVKILCMGPNLYGALSGIRMVKCSHTTISNVFIERCWEGIYIEYSSKNEIISSLVKDGGNGVKISLSDSIRIIGNRGNQGGFFNNSTCGIYISHSYHCMIMDNQIHSNDLNGIQLTDCQGTVIQDNAILRNKRYGILLAGISQGSSNNWISKNRIEGSSIGVDIVESKNNTIQGNVFMENQYGIYLENSENTDIISNVIKGCITGIDAINSTFKLEGNTISTNGFRSRLFGSSSQTGVHLFQSSAQIKGNSIDNDATDGIIFEQGSTGTVTGNAIFANQGAGLKNLDPTVTIQAPANWWGDASGPGGDGPGSGDEVTGVVDYSNWLVQPLGVGVFADQDTVHSKPGDRDSVSVAFKNFQKKVDVLNVTVRDSLGWITGNREFQTTVIDTVPCLHLLPFTVPQDAAAGTLNRVRIRAVSQSDGSLQNEASFYIQVYSAALRRIVIIPDSVWMGQGHTRQFRAEGRDQHDNVMGFTPVWSATGGTIDQNGLYKAGMDTGSFHVTVRNTAGTLEAQAKVVIVSAQPRLTRVEVRPDSIVLFPGGQKWISATGYSQFDSLMTITPVWQATAGTVDSTGLYTAPNDTGRFVIVMKDSATNLADTAKVQVVPFGLTLLSPADGAQDVSVIPTFRWLPYPDASFFVLDVARNSDLTQTVSKDTVYWSTQYRVGPLSELTTFYWRVSAVTFTDSTVLSEVRSFRTLKTGVEEKARQPLAFALYQNYPNPFNPVTTIAYDLPTRSHVTICVYDLRGRLVETLMDGKQDAGHYTVQCQTKLMASGVYFVRMTAEGGGKKFVQVRKMVLVR